MCIKSDRCSDAFVSPTDDMVLYRPRAFTPGTTLT